MLLVEWWPQILPEVAPPRLHRTECLHLDFDLEQSDGCWRWRSNKRGHKLTVVDHIVAIMRENREPMHFKQIAAAFRDRARDIKDNGIHSRLSAQPELFALVKPGTFGLVELGYVKARWIRDIMADFLRQRGAPATVAEIQAAVWAERDAEASSIVTTLSVPQNSRGLFKRFSGHRWGLAEWKNEAASTRDAAE